MFSKFDLFCMQRVNLQLQKDSLLFSYAPNVQEALSLPCKKDFCTVVIFRKVMILLQLILKSAYQPLILLIKTINGLLQFLFMKHFLISMLFCLMLSWCSNADKSEKDIEAIKNLLQQERRAHFEKDADLFVSEFFE